MKSIFYMITVLISIALLSATWGFLIEPGFLTKKELIIPHWSGPPLKIAFFSDLHAGSPHINEKYIEDLISRINAHSPDIILIGGDMVINGVIGGKALPIPRLGEILKNLKAPLGVFAVLGNHDWWNDHERIRSTLIRSGIQVLENQAKLIKSADHSEFWLVGIGDAYTQHADSKSALFQIKSAAPRILFMHDPYAIFEVKEKFFLGLAGHMHGGQIFIPGYGALITPGNAPKEWAAGWVDFPFGSLFVSHGIGTSILPIRINTPPEYVILDLKN